LGQALFGRARRVDVKVRPFFLVVVKVSVVFVEVFAFDVPAKFGFIGVAVGAPNFRPLVPRPFRKRVEKYEEVEEH